MKKIALLASLLFLITVSSFSQSKKRPRTKDQAATQIIRCATMDRVEMLFRKFPERKLRAEALAKETPKTKALRAPQRLTAIVYIPVVFHIVLSDPYSITEEVVQNQIETMNTDFAGLNADSTNVPAAFQAVRGHSMIRFVLAKRTPSGLLTNGIERIFSTTTGNPDNVTDSIKRTSLGGANAWDPGSYLNIWVGNVSGNSGTLGYTQVPGSGVIIDDGIFCNISGFGTSSCNPSSYNKGRTIVHELGHYFGLNHIWGDEDLTGNADKCSGDDFRALTDDGSSYVLPVSLYNPHGKGNTQFDIGDTPNQAIASTDCATGNITDACSASIPGIMYQDYMDYTMDDCYSMFTQQQVARMEYVLDQFRSSLKTSLGGTPPAGAVTKDLSPLSSVNPGGFENTGCSSVFHPAVLTCAGVITPMVLISNNGLNTVNSFTAGYRLNGGPAVTVNLNTPITFGATRMVPFPAISVSAGSYSFTFFTANVNGAGADEDPSNDSLTATLTVPAAISLPVTEGFEGTTFPPLGWSLVNADNNSSWERITPGHGSTHSVYINNYDNDGTGQVDEIRPPKLNLTTSDPVVISFDLAHKNYPDPDFNDRLQVLVSNDCGATFTSYFNKAGADLSTAGSSEDSYLNPAAGDWKTQKIIVDGSILNAGSILVAFRNTSDWGNNIYLDNIHIDQESARDLSVTAVDPPAVTDCEEPTVPMATISNNGFSTITGFKVSYSIDNGAPSQLTVSDADLAPGTTMTVALATFTPTGGAHVITVFSTEPLSTTGTGDEHLSNDTLRKSFFVTGKITPPVVEGFENTVFPPATWAIENPDGGITWERTTDAAKTGTASMVIRNYDYASTGTIDKLVSPVISGTAAYDSMYISFDYAYATGIASNLSDTLELQLTTDCGQTFTTIWKNGGKGLQTVTDATPGARFVPTSTGWLSVNLNLFKYVGSQDFQVYCVAKGNKQNNLYIDNINLYGVILPPRLKKQGYLIYPSPFQSQFIIRNYEVPVNLRSAQVYNSVGQLVWSKSYNGNAYTQMQVDLGGAPAGLYIVKLQYTDKTVVEKIMKQ